MGRTKGARNKSTIEKLSCATEKLQESLAAQDTLTRELSRQEELSLSAQQRAKEIRRQLRELEREITELEKMKREWEQNEKKTYERARINTIIDQLVDGGMSADEIIKMIEGA
ncbi:MAG: hypothetical protein IJI19_08765 [Ruminococcus sp.]|nr:hypothetical protein [Ruminococcus sp.]